MSPRYRSRYRGYYRGRYRKNEQALRHIQEAEELSEELGGTDEIVKEFLFGLDGEELSSILEDYGRRYGPAKQAYADEALPLWKSGEREMSGLVATRIYNLLPPKMPISLKFEIAEKLWEHVGPESKKILRFGVNNNSSEVMSEVENYVSSVVQNYEIPDNLNLRFDWLTSGDIKLKQKILNHLRNSTKKLAIEAAEDRVNIMFNQYLHQDNSNIKKIEHTVRVKKIELVLKPDPKSDSISFEEIESEVVSEPKKGNETLEQIIGWGILALIIIVIAYACNS